MVLTGSDMVPAGGAMVHIGGTMVPTGGTMVPTNRRTISAEIWCCPATLAETLRNNCLDALKLLNTLILL